MRSLTLHREADTFWYTEEIMEQKIELAPYALSLNRFPFRDGFKSIVQELQGLRLHVYFDTIARGLYRIEEIDEVKDSLRWRCAFSFLSRRCLFESFHGERPQDRQDVSWPMRIEMNEASWPVMLDDLLLASAGERWSIRIGATEVLRRLELACLRRLDVEQDPDRIAELRIAAQRLFLTYIGIQSGAYARAA